MSGWTKRCFIWVWLTGLAALPNALQGQSRSFHGIYVGAEAGREDLIAGSFVNGIDFLAQDSRWVASLVAGARYQTALGIVVGIEGTWGLTDGDLSLEDPARNLSIDYANDTQTSVGGAIGFAANEAVLLFAYASEVTRQFDVRVAQGEMTFAQEDEQGMLRYGLGVEISAVGGLHVRFKVGSGRADFGDAHTNIEPVQPMQFGVGLVFQF